MAEIRNLTRNGETFYPLTCTEGLVNRDGNVVGEINDIFDISEYNASGTPPVLATYASLSLALAAVPQTKQKGGMTIRYVQTSDNKYVQWRLTADSWSTIESDWQGVDDEPTAGSDNLVKSGGVAKYLTFKTSLATSNNTAWVFNDIDFVSGQKYYVKLVSGFGNGVKLAVGSTSPNYRLHTGQWIEYTSPATGHPFLYHGGSAGEQPVVEFAEAENAFIPDIIYLGERLNKVYIDRLSGEESATHDSWEFSFHVVKNQKFYVKHVSGKLDRLRVGSSISSEYLVNEKWVEFTAPATGNLFIYTGEGNLGTQPVIEITIIDNIAIADILSLQDRNPIEVTGTETNTSWVFNYPFVQGKKYYVKLVSGYGDNKKLNIGSTSTNYRMHIGQWVEYISPESGISYFYTGTGDKGQAPVMVFAEAEAETPLEDFLNQQNETITTINVSRDGTSKTGRTIDFSGLNAIADALDSITDASPYNRYVIHVEGEFHFTDPLTLTMYGEGEYSAILMKDFVDIEGDGPDKSCIFVDFPANATFHEGKAYNDYQPVFFYGVGGTIRNINIAGKNCRYTVHFESGNGNDEIINIEDCTVVSYGAPDYREGGNMSCFGTGIANGQTWNIKNCDIIDYNGSAFSMHTPLHVFQKPPVVNFINCRLTGRMHFANYQVENVTFVNMVGCTFINGGIPTINYAYYNDKNTAKHGDYTTILLNANKMKALYDTSYLHIDDGKGVVLKIVSLSTGVNSKIRFDHTSSAFNSIIGDSGLTGKMNTIYGWDTQYGYVYRDGGVDLRGQAFGTIDIDEHSSAGNTLGSLLGDCTVDNKQLGIEIDGNNYTITFNENYTDKANIYVIDKINDVIGTVAAVSIFCPANLYYPSINGLSNVISADNGAIFKGMGIVFTSNGMRKAKNSDGFIDGICLDDTSLGQYGRVITMGYLYYQSGYFKQWFTLYHGTNVFDEGSKFGIDPNNDGNFTINATPSILRCRSNGDINSVFEIIK